MLLGIIKDKTNKKEYYIDIKNEDASTKISFTAVDNIGIKKLSIEEVRNLLKTILSSNLTYKEKYGEYDVYLDEANNKRYFKNGKENFFMFLRNNGVSAIDCFEKIDKQGKTKRYTITKAALVLDIILIPTCLTLLAKNIYIDDGINQAFSSIVELNTDEVIDSIKSSKYLSEEEKEILCNEEYFDFVLENSDSSRNYGLRKSFSEVKIESYDESVIANADGYYDPLHPNTIYVLDTHTVDEDVYQDIIIHEFIHSTQSSPYAYIKEASDELFKREFYNKPTVAYQDCVKRLEVLMEIIGPQPVIDCNFKSDTKNFDNALKKYLSEEDANKLIELFKIPSISIVDPNTNMNEVNSSIDELLAKMYLNKTNKSVEEDYMIRLIYATDVNDRIYFNNNKENYNKEYYLTCEQELINELNIDEVVNTNNVEYYVYNKCITRIMNGDTLSTYTQETTTNFLDIPKENEKFITIHFKDNTIGYARYDKEKDEWSKIRIFNQTDYYEPAIPNKFPDQVQPINNKDVNKYKKEEAKSI